MKKILLAILVGLALTVFFYVLGALLSGGGHDLNMITVFFPYSLILGILTEDTSWGRIGGSVAGGLLVLQFPLYLVIVETSKRLRWRSICLTILLFLHFLAVLIGLSIYHRSRASYFHGASEQAPAADGISMPLGSSARCS